MRKVIFDINLSIDGCCDHMKLSGNTDVFNYFTDLFQEVDLFVYGRKTYELMYPYWPNAAKNPSDPPSPRDKFAQGFVSVENIVVFSRSLDKVEGKNTRIVRGNPVEEIRRLKQEPGKSMTIAGLDLLSQLIDTDLIDEFHFIVQPIIVGEGRGLLDGVSLPEKLQLKLIGSSVFESGCVVLRYARS